MQTTVLILTIGVNLQHPSMAQLVKTFQEITSQKTRRRKTDDSYFASIPVVFTIPELFAISEPTKIAAATNTIQPDWAMSNWYEMNMPETVADTAKHIESIIVYLKERA